MALLGAPYIYEISSLRVNIIKWQVKFNPVAQGLKTTKGTYHTYKLQKPALHLLFSFKLPYL